MGVGIAEVGAKGGLSVTVVDASSDALAAGQRRLEGSLKKAQERGKLENAEEVLGRVRFVTDLGELADSEVVIEAIIEDEATKAEVFGKRDGILTNDRVIVASNTSSIPVTNLARATAHPERFVGTHFFNPVPVLPLVELSPSLLTDAGDSIGSRSANGVP